MLLKSWVSIATTLGVGCALASASVIHRDTSNATAVAHFFNECQCRSCSTLQAAYDRRYAVINTRTAFSIGATFNALADEAKPSNTALSAEGNCEDARKNVVCTYMWLNRCYNNVEGHLVPNFHGQGDFANLCKNCRANDPLRAGWLFCDCWGTIVESMDHQKVRKGWVAAKANMSE